MHWSSAGSFAASLAFLYIHPCATSTASPHILLFLSLSDWSLALRGSLPHSAALRSGYGGSWLWAQVVSLNQVLPIIESKGREAGDPSEGIASRGKLVGAVEHTAAVRDWEDGFEVVGVVIGSTVWT